MQYRDGIECCYRRPCVLDKDTQGRICWETIKLVTVWAGNLRGNNTCKGIHLMSEGTYVVDSDGEEHTGWRQQTRQIIPVQRRGQGAHRSQ